MKSLFTAFASSAILSAGLLLSATPASAVVQACPPTWAEEGDAPSVFPGQVTSCVLEADGVQTSITGNLSPTDTVDWFQLLIAEDSVAQSATISSSSLHSQSGAGLIFSAYEPNGVFTGVSVGLTSPFPNSQSGYVEFNLPSGVYHLKVEGRNLQAPVDYSFQASLYSPTRPTSEVPGPLGVAGIGAAFAYSRKLRNRIALQK